MGTVRTSANATYRDYEIDGVPSSGVHEPVKSDIRSTFGAVEDQIAAVEAIASTGIRWTSQVVRVRSTANVVIASALENGDTLNGVVLATGDHVFLGSQTAPAENGLYTVVASGAAIRATFADTAAELALIGFLVSEGTAGAGERWTLPLAEAGITVDTTALSFARIGIEVSVSSEVATARGTFGSLDLRLDDFDERIDVTERTETAIGRASLYGITDLTTARLFAEQSEEEDFTEGYYRNGFGVLAAVTDLPGWSFARNSEAVAIPDGGALETFALATPRITNRGFLIESLTNQSIRYSQDYVSLTDTNLTITAAQVDPAGQAAKKIEATAAGAATLRSDGAGAASASGNTAWAIVKKGTSATIGNRFVVYNSTTSTSLMNVTFDYDTGAYTYSVGSSGFKATQLGGDWWLVELRVTAGVSANDNLYFFMGFVGQTAAAGDYFYMSHAQIESLPFATSRRLAAAPTAVSRQADVASTNFAATGDFTVIMEVEMGAHPVKEMLFCADDGSTSDSLDIHRDAAGMMRLGWARQDNSTTLALGDKSGARTVKIAMVSLADLTKVSVDGAAPISLGLARPIGLSRFWWGQGSAGSQLNGEIKRRVVLQRAMTDAEMIAATAGHVRPLSEAPLVGHPLQARFDPNTAQTPSGAYGRQEIVVYGELPCALLIAENGGPSATAVGMDGKVLFRNLNHLGRWIDVDPITGYSLIGAGDLRTVRWMDRAGTTLYKWTLPVGVPGTIYGLRTNGEQMVVNAISVDGLSGETWIYDLDANGVPFDAGTAFTAFSGAGMIARSMLIEGANLWIAKMSGANAQGAIGEVQRYVIATEALEKQYYSHYPNDIDRAPGGEIIWADEHLSRIRGAIPATDTVRSIMAGLTQGYDYEPASGSISSYRLSTVVSGSILEASAVEYRGLEGLYAPNGVTVISQGLYAIADTDNGRVIIARETDTYEPEIVAVIALLNEPTKVRIIPSV